MSKYTNPPIQEVICELHFDVKEPLPPSEIEKLKAVWLTEYPDQIVTEEKNFQFQLTPEKMKVDEVKLGKRLICKSTDRSRVVQLSGRFLAVNHLKPYPGWEEGFRDMIIARANELEFAIGPLPISRAGLRYINKIEIPDHPLIWQNWFNFALPLPEIENSRLDGFQMHFEESFRESFRLIVNCVIAPQVGETGTSVILDLDVVWNGEPVGHAKVPEILEGVHGPHRFAFESYITDKLRKTFK